MRQRNRVSRARRDLVATAARGAHPLDHLPGSPRCRSLPGGLRRHLPPGREFYAHASCRLGRHTPARMWRNDDGSPTTVCLSCTKTLA